MTSWLHNGGTGVYERVRAHICPVRVLVRVLEPASVPLNRARPLAELLCGPLTIADYGSSRWQSADFSYQDVYECEYAYNLCTSKLPAREEFLYECTYS